MLAPIKETTASLEELEIVMDMIRDEIKVNKLLKNKSSEVRKGARNLKKALRAWRYSYKFRKPS